jgi:hypothetical protein
MCLEGIKLVAPECLYLVEPCLEINEGFGAQPVYAHASIVIDLLLFEFNFDEAAGSEHAQVPTHCGATHRGSSGKLTGAARTFSEKFHHMAPGRVSQRGERSVKIFTHRFTFELFGYGLSRDRTASATQRTQSNIINYWIK